MTTLGLYLNNTYFNKVLEQKPSKSKDAPTQRFIHQQLFPWRDYGLRDVLTKRSKGFNRLATPYGPEGQPTAPPKEGAEQQLTSMIDWKAYNTVSTDIVQQDEALGGFAVSGNLKTASVFAAKVRQAIDEIIVDNSNRIDNSMELVAIGALLDNFQWPPTDDAGSAISTAPNYWATDIGETSWTFGLPAYLNQDLASLVDREGSAATTNQKKYWTETDADIIGALGVMDKIATQNHGFELRGGTIICRSTLLDDLIKNATILNMLRGSNYEQEGARGYITTPSLERFFSEQLGYTFAKYDTSWTYETGRTKSADHSSTIVHYLKENQVIILPPGGLRNAFMGTCPIEHADEQWRPGVMPWIYKDPRPPYNREAGSHVVAWPIFEYFEWATLQIKA